MADQIPQTDLFRFVPRAGTSPVRVPVTGDELVAMAHRSPWLTPVPKPAPVERQPVALWTYEDGDFDPDGGPCVIGVAAMPADADESRAA